MSVCRATDADSGKLLPKRHLFPTDVYGAEFGRLVCGVTAAGRGQS